MSEQDILKIEILPEPEDEAPFVPETPTRDVKDRVGEQASRAKQSLAAAGQKAWDSDLRKRTTGKATAVASSAVHKSSELVREQVAKTAEQQAQAAAQRVKETDWQAAGKQGVVSGLRWLSGRLAHLADRFTPKEKPTPTDEQQS